MLDGRREVARSTVRAQVKHMLRKAGVRRVAELVATVARLPRLR